MRPPQALVPRSLSGPVAEAQSELVVEAGSPRGSARGAAPAQRILDSTTWPRIVRFVTTRRTLLAAKPNWIPSSSPFLNS